MEPLVETVAACLARHGAVGDARIAVALSGGGDSLALADLVATLARDGRVAPALAVHVDHGLRPDSAAAAEAVAALAGQLGLGFHLERAAVDGAASLENAARRARYAAFERAAAARGLAAILIAHTADDQAETVLHRIVRGTGVAGLGGMAERRDRYLRPLLGRRRAELTEHVGRRGLIPIEDAMNLDPRFTRVRLRREVLPALRQLNPQVVGALVRLADQASDAGEALAWAGERLLAEAARGGGPGELWVAALVAAPSPVLRAALADLAATAGIGPLAAVHFEALERLLRAPLDGRHAIDLPDGAAVRDYERFRMSRRPTAAAPPPPPPIRATGPDGPYAVRPWRAGDRMRPLRLGGRSRKLSDLYGELRLPRDERARAQVVTDGSGTIVWAQHIGQAWKRAVEVSLTGVAAVASNKN